MSGVGPGNVLGDASGVQGRSVWSVPSSVPGGEDVNVVGMNRSGVIGPTSVMGSATSANIGGGPGIISVPCSSAGVTGPGDLRSVFEFGSVRFTSSVGAGVGNTSGVSTGFGSTGVQYGVYSGVGVSVTGVGNAGVLGTSARTGVGNTGVLGARTGMGSTGVVGASMTSTSGTGVGVAVTGASSTGGVGVAKSEIASSVGLNVSAGTGVDGGRVSVSNGMTAGSDASAVGAVTAMSTALLAHQLPSLWSSPTKKLLKKSIFHIFRDAMLFATINRSDRRPHRQYNVAGLFSDRIPNGREIAPHGLSNPPALAFLMSLH